MASRCKSQALRSALLGSALLFVSDVFVLPGRTPRNLRDASLMPRNVENDGEVDPRCPLTKDQLMADHGNKWTQVESLRVFAATSCSILRPVGPRVLQGDNYPDMPSIEQNPDAVEEKAASPEAMMRARFTALRFQDPQFLASTERDEESSIRSRTKAWAATLGLEETSFWDNVLNMGNNDITSLREIESFEVVSADDTWVEFKVKCKNGKTLHEKGKFLEDRKWGYVYSGEDEFSDWS
eukprot:TRINITY_DN16545_c0_g1_i2.p1 TRINITY_DN16545_c0_g1~~TRINITY_DN16545_c0_g1_i2.p1  ORF type:complete len:239 (-),score=51.05 TRINITY_DN16545_c0_g1_i2:82-798(-)